MESIIRSRQEIAAAVRALMGRHQVTQEAMAEVLGITQGPMSRRLKGRLAFNTDQLVAIAEHFEIGLGELLAEVDEVRREVWREQGRSPTKCYEPGDEMPENPDQLALAV